MARRRRVRPEVANIFQWHRIRDHIALDEGDVRVGRERDHVVWQGVVQRLLHFPSRAFLLFVGRCFSCELLLVPLVALGGRVFHVDLLAVDVVWTRFDGVISDLRCEELDEAEAS